MSIVEVIYSRVYTCVYNKVVIGVNPFALQFVFCLLVFLFNVLLYTHKNWGAYVCVLCCIGTETDVHVRVFGWW